MSQAGNERRCSHCTAPINAFGPPHVGEPGFAASSRDYAERAAAWLAGYCCAMCSRNAALTAIAQGSAWWLVVAAPGAPVEARGTDKMANTEERALSEAELVAVAALAQVDAMSMVTENEVRAQNGAAPAYSVIQTEASCRLERELRRRGVL